MSFNTTFSSEWILRTRPVSMNETGARFHCGIKVKVYPIWYKQISLEWSVPASYGNCVFNVYFSEGENGPFEKINKTPVTATFFKDTTTLEFSKQNKSWYIVEAELLEKNGLRLRSDPITWDTYQRNWVGIRSQEIQRREYILLSKFVGIDSYLFRKRSYGKRCTACYNPVTEQITNDHCPTCLGTSFEGGYFEPTSFKAQYETTPNDRSRVYYGLTELNQIGAWTISLPEVSDMDIVVRTGDWKAYRVERITPTELQGNTVRQLMILTELSKGDVEYQLIKRNLPEMPEEYV